MAATREDIKEWFERGVEIQATHMVVMVDTFDWDDYPVYIMPGQDPRYEVSVMEVYNLVKPMQAQLDERRNFNY
jgi:hypothetical protein